MRATFQVIIDHQSILPRMLELIAQHATLHMLQIEHDPQPIQLSAQAIELRLLGQFQVIRDGQPVAFGRAKCSELLALLALSQGRASTEYLCDALWPRLSLSQARGALQTTVSALRRQLGMCIAYQQPYYVLDSYAPWRCDVDQFLALSEAHVSGADLSQAYQLYGGPLLGSHDAAWIVPHRAKLEWRYDSILHRLALHVEQSGAYDAARELFQLLIQRNILDEPAHIGVMRCCMALQQRAAAVAQFHMLRTVLDSELGLDLEPESEAHVLYRQLLGG